VQSVYFQEKTEQTISALAFTATATLQSMEDLQQLSTSMNQMLYGLLVAYTATTLLIVAHSIRCRSHSVQAQGELASSQVALRETIDELKDEQVEGLRSMQTHFGELQLLSGLTVYAPATNVNSLCSRTQTRLYALQATFKPALRRRSKVNRPYGSDRPSSASNRSACTRKGSISSST
jgi:hypothetical protein